MPLAGVVVVMERKALKREAPAHAEIEKFARKL